MATGSSDREWHHVVKASNVPEAGIDVSIDADPEECAATAQRLGVSEIRALSLDVSVKPWRKGGLRVDGGVRGHVTQPCVVTLEPVEELVEESFKALFAAESETARVFADAEIVIDAMEDDDPPEALNRGEVDVCQIAIEHLALGINPYPRKDGVSLEDELPSQDGEVPETSKKTGAFDVLGTLKSGAGEG